MARQKRIWRESQHPRDSRGRFAKRGGASWVKRAAGELMTSDATSAGGRPRISRNAKAGAVLQSHTDGGRPSAVRVPKATVTPVARPAGLTAFNAKGLPTPVKRTAAAPLPGLAAFNAPDPVGQRKPRPAPGAADLVAQRRAEQEPFRAIQAKARADMAAAKAPSSGADGYAAMRRHTLVSLARAAGVPHRGKSNTEVGEALAAKDAEVAASRAAKLNPSGVGTVDTPRVGSDNGGMTSTTNTPGPYGNSGDPIPARGSQAWNRAVGAMQIRGPGNGDQTTPYVNRAPEVGDTVTAGGLNRKGTVVRAIRRNRTDGFDVQWEGEPYTRHQPGSSLGVVDVPEVIRRGRGEGAPKVEVPRTPTTGRKQIPRDTKAALMASDGPLGRDGKPIEAKPRKAVATAPSGMVYQTFADRMRGEFSDAERLEMSLKNEEERQKARAREAEAARLRAEARANDTRPEREKLAEQLQQDRTVDQIDMRSGRRNPQRVARIKKLEARIEEIDTEDRKVKIKSIRKGDKVTTTYKDETIEVEVVGKTSDGYLRVLMPDGRRGSLHPKLIEGVTPASKAETKAPEPAAPDAEMPEADIDALIRGNGQYPDEFTLEQKRQWLEGYRKLHGTAKPKAPNDATKVAKQLELRIRGIELARESASLYGDSSGLDEDEEGRAKVAARKELADLKAKLLDAQRAERGYDSTPSRAFAKLSDDALERAIKVARPGTKKLEDLKAERDARAAARFKAARPKADAAPVAAPAGRRLTAGEVNPNLIARQVRAKRTAGESLTPAERELLTAWDGRQQYADPGLHDPEMVRLAQAAAAPARARITPDAKRGALDKANQDATAAKRAASLEKARAAATEAKVADLRRSDDPKDNSAKINAIRDGRMESADLYRQIMAGPSGQRSRHKVGRVRYTPDRPEGEFEVTDTNGGDRAGWATRVSRNGETVYAVHSENADGGTELLGWADTLAHAADVLTNGEAAASTGGTLDARRISGRMFERNKLRDMTPEEIDRRALDREIARTREELANSDLMPTLRSRAERRLARLEAERRGESETPVDTPRVKSQNGGMTTTAQRMVPRLFESDNEQEAIEALHGRGRADLQRIADEIGAPVVPGASEERMKKLIARHHLGIDQDLSERDNLLMEAQRKGIDVSPNDSMDTLRRNVAPKAAAKAKPGETTLGVTTSSRGRTTTVTLPDGSTAQRTSKTMEYSHAVVATHDLHAEARDMRATADVHEAYAKALETWIANGSDMSQLVRIPTGSGSMRMQEQGIRTFGYYLPGFEPNIRTAKSGAKWTESPKGTSAVETRDINRDGTLVPVEDYLKEYHGPAYHQEKLKDAREAAVALRRKATETEAGPQFSYSVDRWSQRAETAHAAIGSGELSLPNRHYQVIGVGGVAEAPTKPVKSLPTPAEKAAALEAKKADEKDRRAKSDQEFVDRTRTAVERAIDEGGDPEDALKSKTDVALRFLARAVGAKLPRKPQTAYGTPAPLDAAEARRLIVEAIRKARGAGDAPAAPAAPKRGSIEAKIETKKKEIERRESAASIAFGARTSTGSRIQSRRESTANAKLSQARSELMALEREQRSAEGKA